MDSEDDTATASMLPIFERKFKFYLLLLVHIPSLSSTIFLLYHFNWRRLVTQIFGFLLLINALLILTELPFTLLYLHEGRLLNEKFCPVWTLINYTLFILSIILTAWTSVERYLFIYHEPFITRHAKLLHYGPVVFFTMYTPSFYIGLVLFYPCTSAYSVYGYICNGPCYLFEIVPCLVDWGVNIAFVLLVTCIFNGLIIMRNIVQRHRMKRSIVTSGKTQRWHRTLKLSFQLFSISSLCAIGWIPYGIVSTLQIFSNTPTLAYLLSTFFIYFPYVQTALLPYACLLFMPEMKQKFRMLWRSCPGVRKLLGGNQVHVEFLEHTNTIVRARKTATAKF